MKVKIANSDLLRHYTQVLEKTADLSLTLKKIKATHGETYDQLITDITSATEESPHAEFLSLIQKNLPNDLLDKVIIHLHYQSAMARLNEQSRTLHIALSGRIKYLVAVFVLALAVLTINEIFIRPSFLEIRHSVVENYQVAFFHRLSIVFLFLSFIGITSLVWLGRKNQGLDRHLKMARSINSFGLMRSVTASWQDYISATFIRLIAASGATPNSAIEAIRQSLNSLFSDQPESVNSKVIQNVFENLDTAHRLDTFREELEYWERFTLEDVMEKLAFMRTILISIIHLLITLLVLLVLVQIYLPVFRLGGMV